MTRFFLLILVLCLFWAASAWAAAPVDIENQQAVLRVLDKTNARVSEITLEVGKPFLYEKLTLLARACRTAAPDEEPEAAVFLEVTEAAAESAVDHAKPALFTGWMFASSPSLSALEHPVYDLWLKECKNPVTNSVSDGSSPKAN